MNYIKHLTGFFEKVSTDYDLNPTHISLYMAIFQQWNQNRFQNPLSISRDELMRISKIASTATYHKCMKELTQKGYVDYKPSYNPFKGSTLEVCNLDFYTKPVPKKELKKWASMPKNEQVSEQLTKQVLNKHQTSAKQVPYINIINNSNSLNLVEQENLKMKNNLFSKKENDLEADENSKKEKKLREKKKNESQSSVTSDYLSRPISTEKSVSKKSKPTLEETQGYFLEKGFSDIEAQKFFNYFESNGWLVGGRTKMKDWRAAARNWMLNAKKFSENISIGTNLSSRANASSDHSGSRTINLTPNHLHVSNQKNYGEAL